MVRIILAAVCTSIGFSFLVCAMSPVSSQDGTGKHELEKKMQGYLSERWTPTRISEFCRAENQYIGASVLPQDSRPVKYVGISGNPESESWAREEEARDRSFLNATEKSFQNRFRQHLVPRANAVGGILHPYMQDLGEVTWFANIVDDQKDCAYCVRVRKGACRWILEVAPLDFANWSSDDFLVHNIEINLLNTMNAYVYSRDKAAYCWKDRVACLVQRSHPELVREGDSVSAYQCDLPNGQRLKAELGKGLHLDSISVGGPIDTFWSEEVLKDFNANLHAALNPWSKRFVDEELGKCKRVELWQCPDDKNLSSGSDQSAKYLTTSSQLKEFQMSKILSNRQNFSVMKKLIREIWADIFDEKFLTRPPHGTHSRNILILYSSSDGPRSKDWSLAEELGHTDPCTRDPNVLRVMSLSPQELGLRDAEFDRFILQLKSTIESVEKN